MTTQYMEVGTLLQIEDNFMSRRAYFTFFPPLEIWGHY